MFVTIKKVVELITINIESHLLNGHRFSRRGRITPGARVPTKLTLNDAIISILDHLKLEVDDETGELVPVTEKVCCDKKVMTIEIDGVVHRSTSMLAIHDHMLRPITDITCPHCLADMRGEA